jgi:type VI secretion system secreted protein VgrG
MEEHARREETNASTAAHARTTCRFVCEDVDREYVLRHLNVAEELGRPYRVEARLHAAHEQNLQFLELLGKSVTIVAERAEIARKWTGIVAEIVNVERDLEDGAVISIVIVPALCAGMLDQRSRVFQDLTPIEILERVLDEILRPHERRADTALLDPSRYTRRTYCTQYKESSFDFAHRVMEEEGIGYFFRAGDGDEAETMVLFDDPAALRTIDEPESGVLSYDATVTHSLRPDAVQAFDVRLVSGSDALRLRGFDWARTPHRREALLQTRGVSSHEVYEHGFDDTITTHEEGDVLFGLATAAQAAMIPLGLPGPAIGLLHNVMGTALGGFTDDDVGRKARVRYELLRRDLIKAAGASSALALAPGVAFELVGHPTLSIDGKYLVTKVVHGKALGAEGEALEELPNTFECIPFAAPWRPARRTRKPRIYSVQTATVTGPEGLEIHTDPYGRVQVKFHWYVAGADGSEPSSCWIRCAQAWAGQGHAGFSFIPRVGMEVIVTFVDGDPDRPLVIGCVHNAANPTPTALPVQATKSVIRTRSVPFGSGYNELSFEDAVGMERLHLRAERDLDELVRRDHTTVVHRDERDVVKRDRVVKVGRNSEESVAGKRVSRVAKSQVEHVGEGAQRFVGGSQSTVIGGKDATVVRGSSHQLHVPDGHHLIVAGKGLVHRQGQNALSMFDATSHPEGESGPEGIELTTPDEIQLVAGNTLVSLNGEDGVLGLSTEQGYVRMADDKIEIVLGGSRIEVTPERIRINKKTFPA